MQTDNSGLSQASEAVRELVSKPQREHLIHKPAMHTSTLSRARRELLESYMRGTGSRRRPGKLEIAPRPAGIPTPLSYGQQLLWLHAQLAPGLPVYNEPITIHRIGPLDVAALERSLSEIVRRHEAWRTTFATVDGNPVQVVNPPPTITLPVTDLRGLDEIDREVEALRLAAADASEPFDLAACPLFRARLIRLGDEEHRLFLTLHHIIFDGVSTYSVFLPELTNLYEAFSAGQPSPLAELSIQYGDYAYWQRQRVEGGLLDDQMAYWRKQLAGDLPATMLPADRVRPARETFRGAMQAFALPQDLSAALKALCRREGVTLFMTLLAVFKVLLFRYSGQEDVVVGTVTSGRKHAEIQPLLGFFLNPLVLRTDLSGNPKFRELLRRVREVVLGALSHDEAPFELLVKELRPRRELSRNPLYQVLFSLEPPMPKLGEGWDLTQIDIETGASKFDLYLELDDRPHGIVGRFMFNTDLFERATIARMLGHWRVLLESVVADPDQPLSKLRVLTDGERRPTPRRQGVTRPGTSFDGFSDQEIEQSIPARFERIAERHANRLAVKTPSRTLTYGALNKEANRIAHALVRRFGCGEQRIALLFEHDTPMIAGMLGALKAGKTYVALDPLYPRDRLSYILEDADADAILTNDPNLALARRLTSERLTGLNIDEIPAGAPSANPALAVKPDALAYILYTSGSTGRPKGTMQNHRNVLFFIRNYTNELHIRKDDVLTQLSSYSFDAAIMDVYGALLNGALLCPIDVRQEGIEGLVRRLSSSQITIYHSTPTVYRHLVHTLAGREAFPVIRAVVLGGEEVHKADLDAYKKHFSPQALFVNLAGQTESSISLVNFLTRETTLTRNSVPIGYPLSDTDILLLDKQGDPTELFGEIAIRSAHVALGYWRKPELTRELFLPNPDGGSRRTYRTGDLGRLLADGSFEFVGRRDFQVKIRGFRIEPGEIEAALVKHPAVRDVVVAAPEGPSGERRLVAYWVPNLQAAASPTSLRKFLKETLPDHMVPSVFMQLEELPKTPSGKVDRQALPVPDHLRADAAIAFVAPKEPLEILLSRIWEKALGVKPIGLRDDFFELGGHSLLAVRMFDQIEKTLGRRLPLATLFQAPTIEQLSGVLLEHGWRPPWSSLVAIQPLGSKPPFFGVHGHEGDVLFYANLSHRLGLEQPFYALQARGLDGKQARHTSVEEMAAHYIEEVRGIQPDGPYFLGGYCFGGKVAFEMARQLESLNQKVALLALFDAYAPGYRDTIHNTLPTRLKDFAQKTGNHIESLMLLERREKVAYLRKAARRVSRSVKNRIKKRIEMTARRIYLALGRSTARARPVNAQPMRDYIPQPCRGRLTLFRARWQPGGASDPKLGWGGLASEGVEVHEVPGYYDSILSEPRVRVLTEQLKVCLDEHLRKDQANTHEDERLPALLLTAKPSE